VREPPDLRDLVGERPPEELARLREVDSLLRRVPAPPHELPASLTQAVAQVPLGGRMRNRRRATLALAFAAVVVAALAFGLGRWTGDDFDPDYTVDMAPTASAPGATASVQVGERDEDSGNVELLLDVSGLPKLDEGEGYALWLEQDGSTTVRMTVAYDFRDFDAWVISAAGRDDAPPPLLTAEITA
jgi:hypothetical protein